jgi:hypothetical protein
MAAMERRKIVVIEDDDEVRGLIRHILQGGPRALRHLHARARRLRPRFHFHPGDPGKGMPLGESFSQLILEGCRRLDEKRGRTTSGAG